MNREYLYQTIINNVTYNDVPGVIHEEINKLKRLDRVHISIENVDGNSHNIVISTTDPTPTE